MNHDIYIYLLIMSAVTIAIRVVPLTLIRRQIRNRLLRSFLFYVPYVTLAVMTFPAITEATQTPISGTLALTYRGQAWPWWYRTPYPYVFMGRGDSGSFFQVTATGFPSSVGLASSASGVVLGFCL